MQRKPYISRLGGMFLVGVLVGGWFAWKGYQSFDKVSYSESPVVSEKQLMGTRWIIQVAHTNQMSHAAIQEQIQAAFEEVARVESIMSEWKPDSPVSVVNDQAGKEPVEVPDELRDIILRARQISEKSHGAFDITWKGMGKLWDLRDPVFSPPDEETIQKAVARVDYRRIMVDQNRVALNKPGMQIGLGGIAKGYGIDRAGRVLRKAGLNNFYIDGGGDILVAGLKYGRPWRVAVRHPRKDSNQFLTVVEMSDGAIVTSGDYENFRMHQGVRYHHILDPRTGRPANGCQSVTVIAPLAETADALATAVFVLGPAEGLRLIREQPQTEVMLMDAQGQVHITEGFNSAVR
jgi:thiamine biosynthesis lipoprotein